MSTPQSRRFWRRVRVRSIQSVLFAICCAWTIGTGLAMREAYHLIRHHALIEAMR